MKSIGEILKDARVRKKYSVKQLENITKIRASFIEKIESQKWGNLPPFPTVLGFVKSLSMVLDVDPAMAVAVLKRDYPPKNLRINPKPDVSTKVAWSPKTTFMAGIVMAVVVLFTYLGFQYYRFVSPPRLSVDSPKDNQAVTGTSVSVFGSTDSDAKILVDNQPVLVDENGNFSVNIDISSETREIVIEAISRSGKSTTISRKIIVQ